VNRAIFFCVFPVLFCFVTGGALASDDRCGVQSADGMDVEEILAGMQKAYDKVTTITAQLKMVTISLIFDEKSQRQGRIYLKKPYEFRWDIERPYAQ